MTDIEQKALALVEECSEYGALYRNYREVPNSVFHKALCRAADRIEALEAENEQWKVDCNELLLEVAKLREALKNHSYTGKGWRSLKETYETLRDTK